MSDYWSGKRVIVTGASGFLGKPLCVTLEQHKATVLRITRKEFDLRYKSISLIRKPIDVFYHLAADVGGIADNISRPAELFYNNVLLNANVVGSARYLKVGKFIALGSSCAYPSDAPLPLVESDYLKGEPEPTNAPYAYSKRLLLSHLQAAHTQYGLDYTYLILANLYGEGCETDPQRAHVIGALVRKFYEAKRDALPSVTLWGTGEAIRDFLHVNDAIDALISIGENKHIANAVLNIGSESGVKIRTIANAIAGATGYEGRIEWDESKPDGQAKRVLNCNNSHMRSPWRPHTRLNDGLMRLVMWYASTQKELSPA